MPAGGFKVFVDGEVLDANDINDYLMQGILVFSSEAARDSAISGPAHGMFAFTTDEDKLWYYDGVEWVRYSGFGAAVISSPSPTGNYTDANGFEWNYYQFTSSGTLVVAEAGLADVLVVGGSGGGTNSGSGATSGGGGGVRYGGFSLPAGSLTVTVGAGGALGADLGSNGGSSSLAGVLSVGGGQGGQNNTFSGTSRNGLSGGGSPGGLSAGADRLGGSANVTLDYTGSNVTYGNAGSLRGNGASGVVVVRVRVD